ncbi:MAG: thiamine phosphate synthase [Ktedonobacteraceae bacterium]
MNKARFKLQGPQLCLVTDPTVPDLGRRVETSLDAGITMLQVRGTRLSAHQFYDLALALSPGCQRYGVPCIINDRIDVGLVVQADGFQLGRRSLPMATVRGLVGPDYLLGASVHSLDEVRTALNQGADFLLAGTIFASRSHPGEPASGPQYISAIRQSHPAAMLIAIGGITAENAPEVMAAGANGVAVISAILNTQDVARAVKALRRSIGL